METHKSFLAHQFTRCISFLVLILVWGISGCQAPKPSLATSTSTIIPPTTRPSATPHFSQTPSPTATHAFSEPTIQPPSLTPTPPVHLCSPLEGIQISELPELVTNPFNPPRPGRDEPHTGVDFAFYRFKDKVNMLGLPVYAVLSGKVAAVVQNRYPYGNMLMIETELEQLPPIWLTAWAVPTPGPTNPPISNLICPTVSSQPGWNEQKRSIYLVYAHLYLPPAFHIGDPISCGQRIGQVGNTGDSTNEHLHLEARVGPAGATFTSMAHYDNSASAEEMHNYCNWRVSGIFQMFDPMKIFEIMLK